MQIQDTHLGFPVFAFPDAATFLPRVQGQSARGILVVHTTSTNQEDEQFLDNILKASQLQPKTEKIFMLAVGAEEPFPLAMVMRQLEAQHVLLFGVKPQLAGLRASVPTYTFVPLGGFQLLFCDSLATIRQAREQQNNKPAAALWQAIKTAFLD